MKSPLVSVVIPAYNSAATLGRALDSVAAQTLADWEVIVVDDGSTDATPEVVADYQRKLSPKLVALRQSNAGPSAARNAGIDRARGTYVCFLDADDEFLPTKLTRQTGLLKADPALGLVFSDYAYVDLHGRRHASVFDDLVPFVREIPYTELAPGLRRCGDELLERMIGRYIVSTITGMVRRDILTGAVRFPEGFLYCEEWLFFLEAARRAPGGYVNEALSLHHHTRGSVSRTSASRNTAHRVRALAYVLARFPEASPPTQCELRNQLRQCCRQLGMDHFKAGRYHEASQAFRQALAIRFDARSAYHAMESLIRHLATTPRHHTT